MQPFNPYKIANEHGQLDSSELRRMGEEAARLAAMDLPGSWWTPHGIAQAQRTISQRKDLFYWRHYVAPTSLTIADAPWHIAGLVDTLSYSVNTVSAPPSTYFPTLAGLLAVPFITPRGGTVTHMGMIARVPENNGYVRLGIYTATDDDDLRPLARVADAGVMGSWPAGSPFRYLELATPVVLDPDALHFAVCDVTTEAATYFGFDYILPNMTILGKTPTLNVGSSAATFVAGWRSLDWNNPLSDLPAEFGDCRAVNFEGGNKFPAIFLLIAP